ncbi:MAG: hypothetical protein HZA37_02270 [Parcubacteria group bacterium]|nr:hypothetical protein [Parcubacteria group bacterium]
MSKRFSKIPVVLSVLITVFAVVYVVYGWTSPTQTPPGGSGSLYNGPVFSVYKSANQSVANTTDTLITFDTEEFDTNNNFASNRFTPTVAGKYLLTAELELLPVGGNQAFIRFYKNGGGYKRITADINGNSGRAGVHGAVIVDANGSSDYFEVYAYQNTGSTMTVEGSSIATWFAGAKISN